jgi:hypothetical protein
MRTITISKGNKKIGRIANVSTVAGVHCDGKSSLCSDPNFCYAMRFLFKLHGPKYMDNYLASLSADYVPYMIATIPTYTKHAKFPSFRLHVSGDFPSVAYVDKWIVIIDALKDIKFFAYTRNWTVAEYMPSLERLRALPNIQLFASLDNSMSQDPPAGWRVAYIAGDSRANGFDCPEEARPKKKKNCEECKFCFMGSRGNVIFTPH